MASPRGKATYADILGAPEHVVAEITGGELHLSPRPRTRHAYAQYQIGRDVGPFGEGAGVPGGWWILPEPELHLADDIVVPDLAAWRRERLPQFPDGPWIASPPDWICEVLSPGTARFDREIKLPIYAREGVTHAWLVDPLARTLEIHRLEQHRWVTLSVHAGDDVVSAPPFESAPLALSRWWAP